MCEFCKNIYTTTEAMEWKHSWWNWNYKQPYTIIVEDNDSFALWNQIEDNFYTSRVMEIKYCPVCGRQLIENYINIQI